MDWELKNYSPATPEAAYDKIVDMSYYDKGIGTPKR